MSDFLFCVCVESFVCVCVFWRGGVCVRTCLEEVFIVLALIVAVFISAKQGFTQNSDICTVGKEW